MGGAGTSEDVTGSGWGVMVRPFEESMKSFAPHVEEAPKKSCPIHTTRCIYTRREEVYICQFKPGSSCPVQHFTRFISFHLPRPSQLGGQFALEDLNRLNMPKTQAVRNFQALDMSGSVSPAILQKFSGSSCGVPGRRPKEDVPTQQTVAHAVRCIGPLFSITRFQDEPSNPRSVLSRLPSRPLLLSKG